MASQFPLLDTTLPKKNNRWRLLLVDDHQLIRTGLRALLELEQDFDIVGEAGDADSGIELALHLRPHVVVTDLSLGAKSGIELIVSLRESAPDCKLLVLTMHDEADCIKAALAAGAHGYLLKDSCRIELVRAIRSVGSGGYYLCSPVSRTVVSGYLEKSRATMALVRYELTGREREIVALVATGLPNKTIATRLGLSVKTIAKHRANFMHKLNLHSGAAVAMYAIKHGFVDVGELVLQLQ